MGDNLDVKNATANTLTDEEKEFDIFTKQVDAFFLIVMGCIVFLMQAGFAFLEAGSVRSKNTVNILIKNMLDALLGGLTYWMIGWGAAYGKGGNGFIGGSNYFSYNMDAMDYPAWFFQFVFAATAATIVSGAIAERCQFSAYFVYSIVITGWVYPVVTHWGWSDDGWMKNVNCRTINSTSEEGLKISEVVCISYADFAGSGIVHVFGAVCALIGCYFIGPREGRYTSEGISVNIPGHSVPLSALGGFILLFGFLAFNGGSQLTISNDGDAAAVGRAIVNTIIGGCGGGLGVLFINKIFMNKLWSYLLTLNGALTGMVSMCAGCNVFEPWAALLIGLLAGSVFTLVREIMNRFRLDDPLDAVAVHGGGENKGSPFVANLIGVVGVLLLPFFAYGDGIFWIGDQPDPWIQLGVNIACLLAIIVWAGLHSIVIFGSLSYFNLLRIDREIEFKGCDITKHGEAAYPVSAWKETQYDVATTNMKKNLPSFMAHNRSIASDPVDLNIPPGYVPWKGEQNGIDNVAMEKI